MLDLSPTEVMERFGAYLKHEGLELEMPLYPEKINEPESTGWTLRTDVGRFLLAVEQHRNSIQEGTTWTLSGGPYHLYADPPPPVRTFKVALGEVAQGPKHEWDLRVHISEVDLATAFSKMLGNIKLAIYEAKKSSEKQ